MKPFKALSIFGILLLLAAAVAAATGLTPITGTWRYKMTVEVETPEGLKTGSAVREVDVVLEPRPGYTPYPYHSVVKVKGEAVVVDLGKRGVLFALMDVDGSYQAVFRAFPGPPGLTPQGVLYYRDLKNAKATLSKQYPTFVRFRDINDPKTVEVIYPAKDTTVQNALGGGPEKDFQDRFGKGVKLKEVTIETTNDPVTVGITAILPWLLTRAQQHVKGYLGGSTTPPFEDTSKTYLNGVEFMRGEGK